MKSEVYIFLPPLTHKGPPSAKWHYSKGDSARGVRWLVSQLLNACPPLAHSTLERSLKALRLVQVCEK